MLKVARCNNFNKKTKTKASKDNEVISEEKNYEIREIWQRAQTDGELLTGASELLKYLKRGMRG